VCGVGEDTVINISQEMHWILYYTFMHDWVRKKIAFFNLHVFISGTSTEQNHEASVR
jgi:hypothetical protein